MDFYRTNISQKRARSLVYEIMTPITAKLKKINYWIAGAVTMMVIFDALYPFAQGKSHISGFGDTANINDDFFIQGVRNVTKSIPKNETLVVTGYTAVIQYFTNHPVKLPWKGKVKSEKTLVICMSNPAELQPIFSNKGLGALTPDFQKIDEVRTESAKLFLYKRI
jgi:hypothetical protein